MNKTPRASLSITLLGDEDYWTLMEEPDGPAVFGAFVAMLVVARDRLQQGKAERLGDSAALRVLSRPAHLISLARLPSGQFEQAIATLERVAKATGGEPWMSLDGDGMLVIRSFFKFNTSTGWGGPRPGAGRPTKDENQDAPQGETKTPPVPESSGNQDEFKMEPTRIVSGSGALSLERENDAGAKPEAKTPPTVVDDDDPVPVIEAIGNNTATQVSQALLAAERCYPMRDNLVLIFVPQWLADHDSRRVIAALQTAKDNNIRKPEAYIRSLLADPTFPREATSGPKLRVQRPEPERLEHRIHRAPRPTGTA